MYIYIYTTKIINTVDSWSSVHQLSYPLVAWTAVLWSECAQTE